MCLNPGIIKYFNFLKHNSDAIEQFLTILA